MANTLPYVGAAQTHPNDITTRGYVASLIVQNLTQSQVNTLLNAGFAGYVPMSYVTTQAAVNATKAFVDAGDATRLQLRQIGVNNGIAGLTKNGRIEVARVAAPSTQRFPKPFYSPSAYNASAVSVSANSEVSLYTYDQPDPGFTYKLLITGLADASTSVDAQYPIINVRQGSATGQLVASGSGLGEFYAPTGGGSPSGSIPILPVPVNAQTSITGGTTLYVMLARSGISGQMTVSTLRPQLCVLPVPA